MRVAPWRERLGSEGEHGEERVDPTVKEARFQRGEGGQAKRTSQGERRGSSSEGSGGSWFYSKSGQT